MQTLLPPLLQQLVGLGLLGLGVYFAVQLGRGAAGYLRYRRIAPTALVSWPAPAPAQQRWLVLLGITGAATAAFNAWMQRPLSHVVGLTLMAAYFLGLVPLVVAAGAGAASRRAVGTAVFGGMLAATVVGVFLIPSLYVVFQQVREKVKGTPKTEAPVAAEKAAAE